MLISMNSLRTAEGKRHRAVYASQNYVRAMSRTIDLKAPPEVVRNTMITYANDAMRVATDSASAISAVLYDEIRRAETGSALGAIPVNEYTEEVAEDSVRYLIGDYFEGGTFESFVEKVCDRIDSESKRAQAQSIMGNARRDSRRVTYARVPTGIETCPFCIMLASRGFAYLSEWSAGAWDPDHYHANCDCIVVPSFNSTKVQGYDPDAYYRMYKDAADQAKLEGGGNALNRTMNIMRRNMREQQDE